MNLFQTDLRAFHGNPAIKQKYIDRVKWHQEQDNIIKGKYAENGKGCAVACTLDFQEGEFGWYQSYEVEMGIPGIIARLEDGIFERLSDEESKKWPLEFLEIISVGADLSQVWPKFAIWLLIDDQYGVMNVAKIEDKPIIQHIADLYQNDNSIPEDFRKATDDAYAAANAAYADTIFGAANAAYAAHAAAGVAAVHASDDSVDNAAFSAAVSAARAAAYDAADAADGALAVYMPHFFDVMIQQRNKLLELLKESPIKNYDLRN